MRRIYYAKPSRQRGLSTLTISVLILLVMTVGVLYTAGTARKEQQISADQYRTEQSLNAAMAGIDWALDYYSVDSGDHNNDGLIDHGPHLLDIIDVSGSGSDLTVAAEVLFCDIRELDTSVTPPREVFWTTPEACSVALNLNDPEYGKYLGLVSVGLSDDRTARRVISLQAAPFNPFLGGDGPKNPLTTRGGVDFTGNATIINRYYRDNIWSGENVVLGSSATVGSFVADNSIPLGEERFSSSWRPAMIAPGTANTIPGALPASSNKRGVNADVIDNDPLLNQLQPSINAPDSDPICSNPAYENYYFCIFFGVERKSRLKTMARLNDGQVYTNCGDLDGVTGVAWWEPASTGGECRLTGNLDAGALDEPAFIFVDGNMFISGGTYYGFLYVAGNLEIAGNFTLYGSMVVEGTFAQKAGTGKFIYDPFSADPDDGFGDPGPINGTWKDWGVN